MYYKNVADEVVILTGFLKYTVMATRKMLGCVAD